MKQRSKVWKTQPYQR